MTKVASKIFLLSSIIIGAALLTEQRVDASPVTLPVQTKDVEVIKNAQEKLKKQSSENVADVKETGKELLDKARKAAEKTEKNEKKEAARINICEGIGKRLEEHTENLSEHRVGNKEERLQELTEKRVVQDEKLAKKRAEADTRRALMYAKLLEKADTEEKRTAVSVFQASVEESVKERRATIDAAILAYRTGVDKVLAEKSEANGAGQDVFKEKVKVALEKAKADCEANVNPGTVRSEFQATVNSVKKDLLNERQDAEETREVLKTLSQERKTAIKEAITVFQGEMNEAKEVLKKILGESVV